MGTVIPPPDGENEGQTRPMSWVVGVATLGSVIAGVIALFASLFAFASGEWQAAGVCLVASAIAFGSLANAVLRR
jgi:hypothetical protein